MGVRVHFPSLRLDEVPLDVIDMMKERIKTLTFGIEAGTERLRRRIGKPLTDDDIAERVEAIAGMKSFHFKFYFMVGTAGRRAARDVEAIIDLVRHIQHLSGEDGQQQGRVGTVTVHASPFVPKAATPFQWLAMNDMKELKEKMSILKRGLGKAANTRFTHESVKYSLLQGALARGDRRLGEVIARLAERQTLARITRESPINLNFYVTRERRRHEIFPWDFIGATAGKDRLWRRLRACLGECGGVRPGLMIWKGNRAGPPGQATPVAGQGGKKMRTA